MIVRFHLDAHALMVIKRYNAGIVFKDADTPVVIAQPFANFLSRLKDGLL